MIGAVMAKKKVHSIFDALSRQNFDEFASYLADDVTRIYPTASGPNLKKVVPDVKGKEAFKELYEKLIGEWPVTSFTVNTISVQNAFALTYNNIVMVEWTVKVTGRTETETSDMSAVSVITLKRGKVIEVRQYECGGNYIWRRVGPQEVEVSD
ncbi:nuclear transport factor 2 family protein [Chloroflexota bacterium]